MRAIFAPIIALNFLLCTSASAQTSSGWIQGTVTDKTSLEGMENVEVVLSSPDGQDLLRSRSNALGEFLFVGIPTGEYELTLQKEGYPAYRLRSVRIRYRSVSMVTVEIEKNQAGARATVTLAWQGRPFDPWGSDQGNRFHRARMDNLPSPRYLWALLQNQDISSVTNRVDEGGIQIGTLALVGVHGGTWTQNGYRWDGLNITDPYEPGKPLTYLSFATPQEFQVSGAHHSAAISASGAEFQLTSRRGGRELHGRAEGYYLGDPLQSSNLDDRLRGFGFQTTPHFKRFPEGEFSLGGPIPRLPRWAFFTSLGIQHLSRIIPDFAVTPDAGVFSGLLRMDGVVRRRDQFSMLISGQIVQNSNLGARSGIDPSSTLQGNDRFELVQGHWTHRRSERSVWELSFGFSHASPTDTLQAGITKPNYTRLFAGEMTGAAPIESDSALSRFSAQGQMQSFLGTSRGRRHQLSFGFDLEESLATEEQRVFQGLNLFLFPGHAPTRVAEFNSPSHAKQRLRELSFNV
jgi:hypothetical protein